MSATTAPPSQEAAYLDRPASSAALVLGPAAPQMPIVPRGAVSRGVGTRFSDYVELTKPRIAVMVLLTVTVGYTLGCEGNWQLPIVAATLLGVALVAAGSNSLNQYLERLSDAAMPRTAGRPLPGGTMTPREVLVFGVICGGAGTLWLAVMVNGLTALLTLCTLLLYVGVYTPLKRRTSLCTAVGAVPGALPPVLGWAAARGSLDPGAIALFSILFLWQFPHFLAIAWLYRSEYDAAGLQMLPKNRSDRVVGLMAVTYAVVLIPVSLLPRTSGLAGDFYAVTAVLLGLLYLAGAARFAMAESRTTARGLLFTSLIYLPGLLLVLTFDHLRLLM